MSVTATARSTLDAFRSAVERKDFDALEACYAEDAFAVGYSERNRPGSAQEARGRSAIVAAYREAPAELEHAIGATVVDDDRFAAEITCTYPTGQLVKAIAICEVRDGLIVRETAVEAWDE